MLQVSFVMTLFFAIALVKYKRYLQHFFGNTIRRK